MLNKYCIVTGGAGFIGSHMVDLLIQKKYIVIVIDDLSKGKKKNIFQHIRNKKVVFIRKDIRKLKAKDIKFKKIDFIFHFAGKDAIIPSINNPEKYLDVNLNGTLNILQQTKNLKYKKFVYAASSSCYGKAKTPTSENNPISILHPYALSKYLGEQVALSWNSIYNLPINSVRIFNAYGERIGFNSEYGAMFPILLKQKLSNKPLTIVGNGKQKRDFIYVKDLVSAFYAVANIKQNGKVFNVGSGKPVSVNKIASLISKKKIYIKKRPGEPDTTHANIKKINLVTNWRPKININEGVDIMLKNINLWKNSVLWDKKKIKVATQVWFKKIK